MMMGKTVGYNVITLDQLIKLAFLANSQLQSRPQVS